MMEMDTMEITISQTVGNRTYSLKTVANKENTQAAKEQMEKLLSQWSVPAPAEASPATIQAPVPPQLVRQANQPTGRKTVEGVKAALGEDADLLSFDIKGEYITMKPKEFLRGSFGRIAGKVRGIGGEYISAGANSHFRIHQ